MIDNMKAIYNDLSLKYENDVRSLHWPNRARQELPFKAIMDSVSLNDKSILDVSCGFGDLYFYLKNHNIKVDYMGVDIAEKIIAIGKSKYPQIASRLKVADILKQDLAKKFDYVIISGTFNLKIKNNWAFIKSMLKKCFTLCNEGVIFTLISNYVDFKEDHLFYADPCRVFKFCKTLTKWVDIKYDYDPYEFLTVIYKEKRK